MWRQSSKCQLYHLSNFSAAFSRRHHSRGFLRQKRAEICLSPWDVPHRISAEAHHSSSSRRQTSIFTFTQEILNPRLVQHFTLIPQLCFWPLQDRKSLVTSSVLSSLKVGQKQTQGFDLSTISVRIFLHFVWFCWQWQNLDVWH